MTLEELDRVLQSAPERVDDAADLDALQQLDADLMGRSSVLSAVQRSIGGLDPDRRPVVGKAVSDARTTLTGLFTERRRQLERAEADRLLAEERIDMTVAGRILPFGSHHLISQTIREICEIFIGLGYHVVEGPEAELGWYNFDALNTPPDHPARAESDTMYLDFGDPADEALLRPQTSPMQVRWMEVHEPPVFVVVPGKTFRLDSIDASHLPVFHQIEGLAVAEDITFDDLKGTLVHFAREFFGPKTEVRLRPHFFPFTEPSAELDVACFVCDGANPGCRLCGGAGWLEMLGCGMVDPNVFEAVGYDPDAVTGFAFGMGVERMAMVRNDIHDIRFFVDNDVRFLSQFP